MSLRVALEALHADPELDVNALPSSDLSLAIVQGLQIALAQGLVDAGHHAGPDYVLTETGRIMVERPVRLAFDHGRPVKERKKRCRKTTTA